MTGGRIVVGVDGSAISAAALRWAVAEADKTGRVVEAVTAWSYTVPLVPGTAVTPAAAVEAEHRKSLAGLVATVHRPGVTVRARVVEGEPAEVLLAAASGADLLALGSHGRGTVARALVGSVSADCLRHATCPVVVLTAAAADPERTAKAALTGTSYQPGPIV